MFADETDQGHQAYLGVYIQAGPAHIQADENQGPADGHGHTDQNDKRIAEAFEQRGQGQEDDNQGKDKGDQKRFGFRHILPGLSAVIDAVARWKDLLRQLTQCIQGLAHSNTRNQHS